MRWLAGFLFALAVFLATVAQPPRGGDLPPVGYVLLAGEICGQPAGDEGPRGGHCPLCITVPPAILPGMAALPARLARRLTRTRRMGRRLSLPPRPHPCPFACGPPRA